MRYDSCRALDADHAAYLTHGGMMLPVDAEQAPAANTPVVLRIEGPLGASFVLDGRAGTHVPGRGLMVSFEDKAQSARDALDAYIESDAFRAAVKREPPTTVSAPKVGPFDVRPPDAEPATDPVHRPLAADLFEETTPIDPPYVDNQPPLSADPSPIDPGETHAEGTALHPDVARAVGGARRRRPAPTAERPPTVIRQPRAGEEYHVAVIKLFQVTDFVDRYKRFFTDAELDQPCADSNLSRGQIVLLRLTLPGHNVFEMWSVVEDADPRRFVLRVRDNDEVYLRARLYPDSVAAKARLKREAQDPDLSTKPQVLLLSEKKADEDESKMPLRRRLARMGMDDKINLALSGNREERMALAMDSNKAVHHYLLKNAKLTLDEIAFMARLPSLNPDVLDKIAENPSYTQNPTVTKALVFNPRTPVRTAIRLLDRLPRNELMNLSKRMSMNQRLVMAAKNKLFKIK